MNQGSEIYSSPRRTSSWRGRFIDGVWHCDCDPRLPADHFQTKNGGVNHGRWFYTCQKPQPQRCKFFLWDDDAQIREKHTLLANSRSEPDTPKKSPSKSFQVGGLLTPGTGTTYGNSSAVKARTEPRRRLDFLAQQQTPTKVRKSSTLSSDEEAYSWDESLDNEAGNLLNRSSSSSTARPKQPVFTSNKAPRTATNTSPSKRKLQDVFDDEDKPPPYSESAPTTQSSSTAPISFSSVDVSATPTPRRYKDVLSAQGAASHQISDLASNILAILDRHDVVIPTIARDEIVASLDQHHLKTQGIIRGRDLSRMALKKKDEEIQALKERIERLETEREMDKVVISCLSDENSK
ncbi:conserved hypothetical protein [Talaromyces stipitatus ATCC 10500]|uniref:GRF-type domain-containing protein n=1 Tax=Talaromyces stipitatus (strain ATCC 10500 / CBS 375.48 / QM 6759 / NRRL 1006) TaxID=441959 RepID=B8MTF7_TALSN|nr:uncharacterized protein TSTA_003470 [Talaromyces stipitatus ATCC 10500]EED12289.1 conserved hypothetical protein [Talaromyces stipitatus ATCC 10500]